MEERERAREATDFGEEEGYLYPPHKSDRCRINWSGVSGVKSEVSGLCPESPVKSPVETPDPYTVREALGAALRIWKAGLLSGVSGLGRPESPEC